MDSTEKRLLNAAGEVFAEKGFEAATIRDICRRADLANIASVNYYFKDKESLYLAVVSQAFQGSAAPPGPIQWPADFTPAQKIRTFIIRFAEGLIGGERPSWHYGIMARELGNPSVGCLAFVRDFARPHFNLLINLLREVAPPNLPETRLHLIAESIVGQCVHHRCARTIITQLVGEEEMRSYTAERLGSHIADFSLAALGLDKPVQEKDGDSPGGGRP